MCNLGLKRQISNYRYVSKVESGIISENFTYFSKVKSKVKTNLELLHVGVDRPEF